MAALPTFRTMRRGLASSPADAVLSILTPSTHCSKRASVARFSSSPASWKGDNNKNRGVSILRHTGPRPRQTLSVREKDYEAQELPKPVKRTGKLQGAEDHGLWDFFQDRRLLTPVEEAAHGRAWTIGELRERDWDVLHRLWWVCVKERNRLATEKLEIDRRRLAFGTEEIDARDKTVQKTMKAILDTLAERDQAFREAQQLARNDPDIDWDGPEGPVYQEPTYEVEDQFEAETEKVADVKVEDQATVESPKGTSPSREETLNLKAS